MSPIVYSVVHVVSAILLVAFTFQAFASPRPECRRQTLMLGGVLSLLTLVAGFGLLAKLDLGFPGWILVKLVCWLALSAFAGLAFRRPQATSALKAGAILAVIVAVYCVYYRPF